MPCSSEKIGRQRSLPGHPVDPELFVAVLVLPEGIKPAFADPGLHAGEIMETPIERLPRNAPSGAKTSMMPSSARRPDS
ncbi:MAG: hypothetical protein MZV63_66460 [Marinilabiliales bacterium]|nr:hypothetical protein [Marinilabiliales bacterium]